MAKQSGFKVAMAVAAAALLWSETATAAVTPLPARMDPLVALSVLGTVGSQNAVCGDSAQAAAAGAAAAAQGAAGGCVLPVTDVPPPPPPTAGPPPPLAGAPNYLGPLLVALLFAAAFIAIKSSGYNTGRPISPV